MVMANLQLQDPENLLNTAGPCAQVHEADESDTDVEEVRVVQPRQTLQSSSSDSLESKVSESCVICFRPYKLSSLINTGCKMYPRLRCKPCHAAARQLERAAASEGDTSSRKEQLNALKKGSPEKWANLILTLRVAQPDDPAVPADAPRVLTGVVGGAQVGTRSDKTARARTMMSETFSKVGTQELADVVWLTQRQFIAWLKRTEDVPHAEAELQWYAESQPGSKIPKRWNAKNELLLPVLEAPRTRNYKDTGSKRSFAEHNDDDSGGEGPESCSSLKKVRSHNAAWAQPLDVMANAVTVEPASKKSSDRASVASTLAAMSGAGGSVDGDLVKPKAVAYAVETPCPEALAAMGLVKVLGSCRKGLSPNNENLCLLPTHI